MQGHFFFSTLRSLSLRAKATLQNFDRSGDQLFTEKREKGLNVHILAFQNGKPVKNIPSFAKIPKGGSVNILDTELGLPENTGEEFLIVARCESLDGSPDFFPQEHVLTYEQPTSGFFSPVLYDQMPIQSSNHPFSPIVLLAPKIWIGSQINTLVVLTNAVDGKERTLQGRPFIFYLFDKQGRQVWKKTVSIYQNSSFILDLKQEMKDLPEFHKISPTLFNLVAKGGSSHFAITAVIVNSANGHIAIEHSLSPPYYASGDLSRLRSLALEFGE